MIKMSSNSCTPWAFLFSYSVISVDSYCVLFAVLDHFPLMMLGTISSVSRHFILFYKFIFKYFKAIWFCKRSRLPYTDLSLFQNVYWSYFIFSGSFAVCFPYLSLQKTRFGSSCAHCPQARKVAQLWCWPMCSSGRIESHISVFLPCKCMCFTGGSYFGVFSAYRDTPHIWRYTYGTSETQKESLELHFR